MHRALQRFGLVMLASMPDRVFGAVVQHSAEPARMPEPLGVSSLIQLTLGMVVVLSVMVGIAWLLKRTGRFQGGAAAGLRVLGGLSMGARERVVLLQVGETQLLVGVTPGSVTPLHVLNKPIEAAPAAATIESGFAGQLNRLLGGGQRG